MKGKIEIKLKRIVDILAKKQVQGLKTAIILDPKLLLLPKQRSAYSTRITFSYRDLEELTKIIKEMLHFAHVISNLSINFSLKMFKLWQLTPNLLKEQLQLAIEGGEYLRDFAQRFSEQFLYSWLQSLPRIVAYDANEVADRALIWKNKDLNCVKAGLNGDNDYITSDYSKLHTNILEASGGAVAMHDSVGQEPYHSAVNQPKCGEVFIQDISYNKVNPGAKVVNTPKNRGFNKVRSKKMDKLLK